MKISFIGGGNMATALIAGLVGAIAQAEDIHVVDPYPEALERLRATYGVTTAPEIGAAVAASDVIVLAVKPQQMRDVALRLQSQLGGRPLLLSIAAGIRAGDLSRWLGGYGAIVRTMPNTPALIGQGIAGLYARPQVTLDERLQIERLLQPTGTAVWVEREEQLNAVTALSGSGPAYVFYFIEAMMQAAEQMGLPPETGRELALATFAGATELARQSAEPPEVLRERVTSKGGTTHAALSVMENHGVKQHFQLAMQAARRRAEELGLEFGGAA